jgi:hypothetical protein
MEDYRGGRSMADIVVKVQNTEKTLPDQCRDFACFCSGLVIQRDRLSQGIHHKVAILAVGKMFFDLCA